MVKKVTWKVVFDDFKSRYPSLSKRVRRWAPYNFLEIVLFLNDDLKLTYSYMTHQASFITE